MSNIQISAPFIPYISTEMTPSASLASTADKHDAIYGARHKRIKLAATGSGFNLDFNLGSGTTKTADHLIIARADLLQSNGVTGITLDRSTNGSSWTTEHTVSSFSSYTLKGSSGDDLFDTFTESSAYQYWRLAMTGSSSLFQFSKVYFGQLFDFGSDPVTVSVEIVNNVNPEYSTGGTRKAQRTSNPRYRYKIDWRGITTAKTYEFTSALWARRYLSPVYIVTTTNHEILNNHNCVHCDLVSFKNDKVYTDYNNISLEFIEVIG